jgi:lipoyl-dependent peroxiredoxin
MLFRKAEARWKGNLTKGNGRLSVGSGAVDVPYSLKSRLEDGQSATNPEELLGAAHAGCFTMALAAQLSGAGFTPTEIQTEAKVSFDKIGDSFAITRIDLQTSADVAGIDDATFQALATDAKKNCPVSKALAAIDIGMKATLKQTERAPAAAMEKN